jgi:hypothetical protein
LAAFALLISYFVWSDSRLATAGSSGPNSAASREKPPLPSPQQNLQSPPPAQPQEIGRGQSAPQSNAEPKQSAKEKRQPGTDVVSHGRSGPPRSESTFATGARPSGIFDLPETTPRTNSAINAGISEEPARARSSIVSPRDFSLDVYSRNTPLSDGISFASGDPTLGELAQGDLKAIVQYDGVRQPRNKLVLEWSIDQLPMDKKAVQANQLVEYGNEPTPGYYRVKLLVDGREAKTFSFRITP